MKTDDLLRKLAPLEPRRVPRWRRALDFGDAKTVSLLERQIAFTAYRRLGDPRKLFLSLPSKRKIAGPIRLGMVRYEEPKWPAGLRDSELLQNVAIFGRSGAGKTNVCFHLLEQLARNEIPFVFLDWKRTGRHLIPLLKGKVNVFTPGRSLAPFSFNPLLPPPGLESEVYTNLVVDALGDAFTLGDGARSLLQRALLDEFNEEREPTLKSLQERLRSIPDRERVRGWKISAMRALETASLAVPSTDGFTQARMVANLLESSSIIELDALSAANKRFLLPLLSLWIYHARLAAPEREKLKLVLVVEEAHHVLHHHRNQRESVMEMLLRQCREIGMAMIVVDQHPHLMSSAALGNTYASICLNLKDPKDMAKAGALSLMSPDDAKHFSRFPVGRGVVKLQDRWHEPFLVDFPLVPIKKGSVTDERLRTHLQRKEALSAPASPQKSANDALARSLVPDEACEELSALLLSDIYAFPNDGVDSRYKRLGVSADKGHRLKQKMLALGVIEEQEVSVGSTRRKVLRANSKSRCSNRSKGERPESIAHEFWKRRYAERFRCEGYDVALEAERNEGRMDVLASRDSESVAIEVETGLSDVLHNVRQDLLFGVSRVVVVATAEKAWARVQRQLEGAGLLSGRVDLVLQDGIGMFGGPPDG